MDENFPKGLDFSYLIVEALGGPLTVSDKDLPSQNLKFGVSDERFKVLENETKRTEYNDTQGYLRFTYEPRIAVKSQLNSSESPITFNLIATVKTFNLKNVVWQTNDLPSCSKGHRESFKGKSIPHYSEYSSSRCP